MCWNTCWDKSHAVLVVYPAHIFITKITYLGEIHTFPNNTFFLLISDKKSRGPHLKASLSSFFKASSSSSTKNLAASWQNSPNSSRPEPGGFNYRLSELDYFDNSFEIIRLPEPGGSIYRLSNWEYPMYVSFVSFFSLKIVSEFCPRNCLKCETSNTEAHYNISNRILDVKALPQHSWWTISANEVCLESLDSSPQVLKPTVSKECLVIYLES